MSTTPLIALQNVRFAYGARAILDGISLSIPRGQITAVMGVSGGGKTTVLRLLGGLIQAQEGQYLFAGEDVTHAQNKQHRK